MTALGGYAMTAITALTAQNTQGVFGVHPVPPDFIAEQIRLVLRDIGADAVKLGMLHDAAVIDAVADALVAEAPGVPLVLDPVMIAKGGEALLDPAASVTLKRRLPIIARIITPNIPEAEALSGLKIGDLDEMRHAAAMLLTLGVETVLLKGGHLDGDEVTDILATADGLIEMTSPRIDSVHTHGTGCSLASAIATGLAQGLELEPAVRRARAYVHEAIVSAPGFGKGHGPLNHVHTLAPYMLDGAS